MAEMFREAEELVFSGGPTKAEEAADTQPKSPSRWALVRHDKRQDILMHKMRYKSTSFDVLRAEGTLPFAMNDVWNVVCDMENRPKIDPDMTAVNEVVGCIDRDMFVTHTVTQKIFFLQPREFLTIDYRGDLRSRQGKMLVMQSLEPTSRNGGWSAAVPHTSGTCSGTIHLVALAVFPEGSSTKLVYICCSDPGGWVPAWAVNAGLEQSGGIVAKLRAYMLRR